MKAKELNLSAAVLLLSSAMQGTSSTQTNHTSGLTAISIANACKPAFFTTFSYDNALKAYKTTGNAYGSPVQAHTLNMQFTLTNRQIIIKD